MSTSYCKELMTNDEIKKLKQRKQPFFGKRNWQLMDNYFPIYTKILQCMTPWQETSLDKGDWPFNIELELADTDIMLRPWRGGKKKRN